jgi:hypothetical protein
MGAGAVASSSIEEALCESRPTTFFIALGPRICRPRMVGRALPAGSRPAGFFRVGVDKKGNRRRPR